MKRTACLLLLFFQTYLAFSQSHDEVDSGRLYRQLYSIKYTILGIAASAEFLVDSRFTVNIEPSASLFPILTSLSKPVSGLDIIFPDVPYQKITVEPKFYFLNNKLSDNNSFNTISLAATYHFPERISKNDTTYSGLTLIPRFGYNSNISSRVYFQAGIGYGLAFVTSNFRQHSVVGVLGVSLKFGFVLFKR